MGNKKRNFFVPRRNRLPILIGIALTIALSIAGLAAVQNNALPAQYKKWLEEEVVYIITAQERDVFMKLQTDRERELFIQAFWKHRQPSSDAAENSFKAELYRRIAYANRYYGGTSSLPGWRTDRGRIYIILAEPTSIRKYDTRADLYPTEVWFYQGRERLGLPPGFSLIFFQQRGSGDYILYSPAKDGPIALLTNYTGDLSNYSQACQLLQKISPELASASMSLVEGEQSGLNSGRPTLSSEILLQQIENAPRHEVEDNYARKFLDYKDLVDVEYSANYIDSDSLVKILKDPGGLYFVHYSIQPRHLSLNASDGRYFTTLKINGIVSAPDGKMIYQFDKTASISMNEKQMGEVSRKGFDFHDMFPLIPGTYKISILTKNEASKEFTSLEQTLIIPGESPVLQMTSPILGFKSAPMDEAAKHLKPFRLGNIEIYCQPNRTFAKKETLFVAFQLFGLSPRQKEAGLIRFVFFRDGQTVWEKSRVIGDYRGFPDIVEEFPLADFAPAHYFLNVSFVDNGLEVITAKDEFEVSHQDALPRPAVYSKLISDSSDPLYGWIIGRQLFNAGRLNEARTLLERVYRQRPETQDTALALAQVYKALDEDTKISSLLAPFVRPSEPPRYEIYLLAGEAHLKREEFAQALDIFDRAIDHFGANSALLNSVGACRLAMGRPKEALSAWEQSLQINPEQPDIRKKAAALKDKR